MPTPPASTKTSLTQRVTARARDRWPALAEVVVRFRGQFAYLDAQLPDGQVMPLCRLRYGGSASSWGFAIYLASHDKYEESLLPSGYPVGSPQEVIEKTLTFREHFGDYQRQLFLADHAGLPLKSVLEQLDILGEEVVPVLRKEFDALRPSHVPDGPTHESRRLALAAAVAKTSGAVGGEDMDPADHEAPDLSLEGSQR